MHMRQTIDAMTSSTRNKARGFIRAGGQVLALVLLLSQSILAQSVEGEKAGDSSSIEFLNLEQGRAAIIDESMEPYLTAANDNFLRFCIGLSSDAPIPTDADARKKLAVSSFQEKVQEFSQEEKDAVTNLVGRLEKLTGEDWPLVSAVKWRFLKVDSTFCRGFAHTRNDVILLSPPLLGMIRQNDRPGLTLLLHEKLHVLQRLFAERFEDLYGQYGFEKIEIAEGELKKVDLAQNPDAFSIDWGIRIGDELSLITPVYRSVPGGQLIFVNERRDLKRRDDGKVELGEVVEDSDAFADWKSGYRLEIGLEHPNEVSAYLSAAVFIQDYFEEQPARTRPGTEERIEQTRKGFREILALRPQ